MLFNSQVRLYKDSLLGLQDSSNSLLRSDAAFNLYVQALVANGLEHSVNAAVRRRDSLLAAAAASAVSSVQETPASQLNTDTLSQTTQAGSTTTTPSSTIPTSSQQIASAVLSGQAPQSTSSNLDMAKLALALNNGIGVPGNPIAVTIAEREYSILLENSVRIIGNVPYAALSCSSVLE